MRHILIALLLPLLSLQANAITFIVTNHVEVAESEVVSQEQWIYSIDADINGTLKDDLFLFSGNQMTLGGYFEHNVWGLGNNIELSGTAQHNVRLVGKTIQLKGPIAGNVLALADTLKVDPEATIEGSARLMGNSIIVEGHTHGDLSITASRVVTLSGIIEGNVSIISPEIILQRDTRIGGDLTYTSSKELVPAQGIVAGKIDRSIPQPAPVFSTAQLLSRIMWFFAALMVGIPFITLFPMTTAMATQQIRRSPLKCLGIGALASIGLPLFGAMSISSIIGIPIGALILGGWGFMAYTSRIIIGLVIGTLILRPTEKSIGRILLSMAAGLAVIYIATSIPIISLPVHLVVISMGTGALLLSLFQNRRLMIQIPKELKNIEESQPPENQHEEK